MLFVLPKNIKKKKQQQQQQPESTTFLLCQKGCKAAYAAKSEITLYSGCDGGGECQKVLVDFAGTCIAVFCNHF